MNIDGELRKIADKFIGRCWCSKWNLIQEYNGSKQTKCCNCQKTDEFIPAIKKLFVEWRKQCQ